MRLMTRAVLFTVGLLLSTALLACWTPTALDHGPPPPPPKPEGPFPPYPPPLPDGNMPPPVPPPTAQEGLPFPPCPPPGPCRPAEAVSR
jgi:hypothetical protein